MVLLPASAHWYLPITEVMIYLKPAGSGKACGAPSQSASQLFSYHIRIVLGMKNPLFEI